MAVPIKLNYNINAPSGGSNNSSPFWDWAFGRQNQMQQVPLYSQQAQNIIGQLGPYAWQQLQQNPASFAPLRQQAEERFQTETIPGLAERFTQFGGPGTRNSSAANAALAGAGASLQRQLASDEQMFNMQREGNLMSLLGMGLTPTFENAEREGNGGALEKLFQQSPDIIEALLKLKGNGTQSSQGGGGFWDYIKSIGSGALTGASVGGVPGAFIGGLGGAAQQYFRPSTPSTPTAAGMTPNAVNRYMQSSPNAPLNQASQNIYRMAQQRGFV